MREETIDISLRMWFPQLVDNVSRILRTTCCSINPRSIAIERVCVTPKVIKRTKGTHSLRRITIYKVRSIPRDINTSEKITAPRGAYTHEGISNWSWKIGLRYVIKIKESALIRRHGPTISYAQIL